MAKITRLFKSFFRLLLPVVILLILAFAAAAVWLVHKTAHPPQNSYLVTPEKYGRFSTRGAQVTEETWTNGDGTSARGWLLRGAENAPAVIMLHRYGADRSYVLDLGIKINEATNFTILMPEQRGHGENASINFTSFGGCEADDALSAIKFVRSLKTDSQTTLVGQSIGFYGVEMGAIAALSTAAKDESIKALVLDSVPLNSDELLASAISQRFPFASLLTSKIAAKGTYLYFYDGCYKRDSMCDLIKSIEHRQVLLLAGSDAPDFQASTAKLSKCFPGETKVEAKTDLSPSGYGITNASLEQSEAYDRKVIDFFKETLFNKDVPQQ
ncbi:MAG: hypothetical protein ACR2MG_16330 [Pyrinomonadaceae bacterium]